MRSLIRGAQRLSEMFAQLLLNVFARATYVAEPVAERAFLGALDRHQAPFTAILDNAGGVE